jgi:transcriptional regulator
MYVHPAFAIDRSTALCFAAAHGFGTFVTCADGHPVASPLPFLLSYKADGTPLVEFHVARANGLAAIAERGGEWLLSVTGADAYVSPDWYASPDQVPTWLYESVQLSGPAQVMSATRLAVHLDQLSEKFESWLAPKPPWTPGQISPARYKMLSKAIVGMEMEVTGVEGAFKLNQHKSDADHVAIAQALSQQCGEDAQYLAKRMTTLRPHLDYQGAPQAAAASLEGAM